MGFEEEAVVQLINSDFRDLSVAANQLANHVVKLGGIGFGASFFGLIAAIAAMYVLFSLCLLLSISAMSFSNHDEISKLIFKAAL